MIKSLYAGTIRTMKLQKKLILMKKLFRFHYANKFPTNTLLHSKMEQCSQVKCNQKELLTFLPNGILQQLAADSVVIIIQQVLLIVIPILYSFNRLNRSVMIQHSNLVYNNLCKLQKIQERKRVRKQILILFNKRLTKTRKKMKLIIRNGK